MKMNERIKELAVQTSKDLIGMSSHRERWQDKFAELIVQECISVVSRKCASPTAREALIEHFGVKE